MSPREIDDALVAALRVIDGHAVGTSGMAALRQTIGCTTSDLRLSIQRLQMKGKLEWNKVALTSSMIDQDVSRADTQTQGDADGAGAEWSSASSPSPPEPAPIAIKEQVRREAEAAGSRRRKARMIGQGNNGMAMPSLVERIQTALVEEPADLMRAVNRKHPELWSRVLQLGRAIDQSPALTLYRAIEAGLAVIEADLSEEESNG